MDQATIEAVESSVYAAGYPRDAAAVLLAEVDGAIAGLEEDAAMIERLCREAGAREVRVARDADERARLWQGRKKAFGAMDAWPPISWCRMRCPAHAPGRPPRGDPHDRGAV